MDLGYKKTWTGYLSKCLLLVSTAAQGKSRGQQESVALATLRALDVCMPPHRCRIWSKSVQELSPFTLTKPHRRAPHCIVDRVHILWVS